MSGAMGRWLNAWITELRSVVNTREEMALNRRNLMGSNCSYETAVNLVGGNFLTGLLLLLHADNGFMGLVTIFTFAGNVLQIFSPLLLERFVQRKNILVAGRILSHTMNIVLIGIIPFLPISSSGMLKLLLLLLVLNTSTAALLAPGYPVWHIKCIPDKMRAQFFGLYRIISGVIIYTFILIASRMVDTWKAGGNELYGFTWVRIMALAISVVDIFFLMRIKEYPNVQNKEKTDIFNILVNPFRQKKYLVTVAAAALWSFSASIPGPYFSVYLLKDLQISYSYINILSMLNIPVLIFCTPVWARLVGSNAWFRTLVISMGLYTTCFLGLAFVSRPWLVLYPIFTLWSFILAAGINLVFSNLPFVNIPEGNQANYIGFYSAVNSVGALLGVVVGRQFIQMTERVPLHILGMEMQNKQYILLLAACVMGVCVMIIQFLRKKAMA